MVLQLKRSLLWIDNVVNVFGYYLMTKLWVDLLTWLFFHNSIHLFVSRNDNFNLYHLWIRRTGFFWLGCIAIYIFSFYYEYMRNIESVVLSCWVVRVHWRNREHLTIQEHIMNQGEVTNYHCLIFVPSSIAAANPEASTTEQFSTELGILDYKVHPFHLWHQWKCKWSMWMPNSRLVVFVCDRCVLLWNSWRWWLGFILMNWSMESMKHHRRIYNSMCSDLQTILETVPNLVHLSSGYG